MVGFPLALLLSALGGALLIKLGHESGFVDRPDGFLKPHEWPAVPLGGISIFAAVHAGMAAEGIFDEGLFVASAIVLVLGLIDDRRDLAPLLRLGVEIVAAIVLVVTADLPAVDGSLFAEVFGVVLVVVAINAVNLFDGLDGLAGTVGLVATAGTVALAAARGLELLPGIIVGAALLGFLVWNWHPARMFLGDNGAYSVALFLVYGFLAASPPDSELSVVVASGLIGVYAIDLAVTLLRRRIAGRPLFAGDRSHVYDQLSDRKWPISRIVAAAAGAEAVIAALVVALDWAFNPVAALSVLFGLLVIALTSLWLGGFVTTTPASPAAE